MRAARPLMQPTATNAASMVLFGRLLPKARVTLKVLAQLGFVK